MPSRIPKRRQQNSAYEILKGHTSYQFRGVANKNRPFDTAQLRRKTVPASDLAAMNACSLSVASPARRWREQRSTCQYRRQPAATSGSSDPDVRCPSSSFQPTDYSGYHELSEKLTCTSPAAKFSPCSKAWTIWGKTSTSFRSLSSLMSRASSDRLRSVVS